MRVLLTGAAGTLGSAACRALVENQFEVRAVDITPGSKLPVKIDIGNLLDREACYRVVDGVEAIVHFANHAGIAGRNSQRTLNENVAMNMNVFQAAADLGVKKIAFASSIQVIAGRRHYYEEGENQPSELKYLPIDGDTPPNPGNAYALSKQLSEVMLDYFARIHGMSCIAIRFPGMWDPRWAKHWSKHWGKHPGYLDEAMALMSVNDAARLIVAVLRADLPGFRIYQPSMDCPGVTIPIPEALERFFKGVPLRKPASELTNLVDISRIQRETGWIPQDNIAKWRE